MIYHYLLVKTKKILKKVPVGTSAYQAEWIIDEDEEEVSDEENEAGCFDSLKNFSKVSIEIYCV